MQEFEQIKICSCVAGDKKTLFSAMVSMHLKARSLGLFCSYDMVIGWENQDGFAEFSKLVINVKC